MKVKVRGIYSTALTKLLLENNFEIVQPSLAIRERFLIEEKMEPPDLQVKDRFDLQGVRVLGKLEAVKAFQSILKSEFEDVLTRRWMVSVDGIYKGKIVKSDENRFYVDLGGTIGFLSKKEDVKVENEQVIVQVDRRRIGGRNPVLTAQLKIVGDYAVLIQNGKVGVSLKITNPKRRTELYMLGKKLSTENWGVIWREGAERQSKEILEQEVATLFEKVKMLERKASSVHAPTILLDGLWFMDVEFPALSKKKLDFLRASVVQTLDGHHFYKCCGGKVSASLEMAEKLLSKGKDKGKVEELFKQQIKNLFPEASSMVDIQHVKPSGMVFHLGQAKIDEMDGEEIKFTRIIKSNGFYDGLAVKKEAEDKAVSETRLGEWFIKTDYFSRDDKWKGTYININTPVEIYPKTIRYVDLEVDLCVKPNGETKILDMDKLEEALKNGIISSRLFGKVKEVIQEVQMNLRHILPVN